MHFLKMATFGIAGVLALFIAHEHLTHSHQELPPDIELSSRDPQQTQREVGESELEFARRLNREVYDATYHCSPREFSLSWIETGVNETFGRLLTLQWREGLIGPNMICGLCHQRSITLANVMRLKGFEDAWAYGVGGHVILKFNLNGQEFVSDPDYGVGPFQLPTSRMGTFDAVKVAYKEFSNGEEIAAMFASKDGNAAYGSPEGFQEVSNHRALFFIIADAAALLLAAAGVVTIIYILTGLPRVRERNSAPAAAHHS